MRKKQITISISNGKGGIGKTATAANTAGWLAKNGEKVLLIDLDQNDHLKIVTGAKPLLTRGNNSATMLKQSLSPHKVATEIKTNLSLIPSGGKHLTAWEKDVPKTKERNFHLSELFSRDRNFYDYIIIDSSPTLSVLHANVAIFADYFVVPCDTDILSIVQTRGMIHSLEVFKEKMGGSNTAEILGVLPVKYDSRRTDDELVLADLESLEENNLLGGGILFNPIRQSSNMKTSMSKKKFLFETFPNGKLTKDFDRFINELKNAIEAREMHHRSISTKNQVPMEKGL